jgi:pimeloyl-ACP methyl ester carboxylesterase
VEVSFLDVPGARLYHEIRGNGPLLFIVGSPMASTGFVALAEIVSATHSVVTYDPRGIGNSTREDADEDITPELQADDVHQLIAALGGGRPVDYLGSSGGAVVGLALVQESPGLPRPAGYIRSCRSEGGYARPVRPRSVAAAALFAASPRTIPGRVNDRAEAPRGRRPRSQLTRR